MKDKCIIEIPKIEDFKDINNIARQVHEIHINWNPDLFIRVENPIGKERLLELIQEEKIFVIKNNETILGYVVFDIKENNSTGTRYRKILKIENIGVEEKSRGKGLGTMMLNFVKDKAKEKDCTDLSLTVNQENEKAIKVYESFGMKVKNIAYSMKLS